MDPLSAQLIVLFFAFVFILAAVAAGAALFTMNPQQQAGFITVVIGGLDLLVAAAMWLVIWWDSSILAGVPHEVLLGLALWGTLEGIVYVGLAIGIARRDKLCALLSAVLSSLSTVLYLLVVDAPSKGGVAIRFVLLAMLWRAFLQLRGDLVHEEHLAQRRRDLDRLHSRGAGAAPVETPPPVESPPPRSRRYEPAPFETTPPSESPSRSRRLGSATSEPTSEPPPLAAAPLPPGSAGPPRGRLIGKRGAAPPPVEDPSAVPPSEVAPDDPVVTEA